MNDTYDIAVTTLLYRDDGELFADLGTMRWFGVDEEVREWLAGSCKTTAFWLMNVPEVIDGESYTLKYRTLVTQGSATVSDTTLLEFPGLSYADVVRFEQWALRELGEMMLLFERKHGAVSVHAEPRSKVMTTLRIAWQWLRNKM
jgi:hypothetical protein